MLLQKTTISIPLGGLDTKTSDKLLTPPSVTRLENAVFRKNGEISKRYGFEELNGEKVRFNLVNEPIGSGNSLGVYNDELLMFSSGTVYTYMPASDGFVERASTSAVNIKTTPIIRNPKEQLSPSRAEASNVVLMAWEQDGGIRCKTYSSDTGAVYLADELVDASGVEPKCISYGNLLFVFYRIGTGIWFKSINPSDPLGFYQAGLTIDDVDAADPLWDICAWPKYSKGFVAYNRDSNVGDLHYSYVSTAGARVETPGPSSGSAVYPKHALAVSVEPTEQERVGIAWVFHDITDVAHTADYPKGLWCLQLSSSLQYIWALDHVDTQFNAEWSGSLKHLTVAWENTASCRMFYDVQSSLVRNTYVKTAVQTELSSDGLTFTSLITSGSVLQKGAGLVSEAFRHATSSYVLIANDTPLQPTNFLLRGDGFIEGYSLYSQAGGFPSGTLSGDRAGRKMPLSPVQDLGSNIFKVGTTMRDPLESVSGSFYTSKGVAETLLKFDDPATCYASAQLGQNLHVAGGALTSYDGTRTFENGFFLYPEPISATQDTGGSLSSTGYYQYAAIYRWLDEKGQMHVSAPSVPLGVQMAGGNTSCTVSVPTCRITNRSNVKIELYRTLNAGSVFYKVASVDNDIGADKYEFVEGAADTAIATNEFLYTDGGVLEAYAPEAASIICVAKNRLFLAGLETDANKILFSREFAQGEAVAFNPDQFLRCDPDGGDITALTAMDDKVLIFKEDRVFAFAGDGPSDNGLGQGFTSPQLITSDVGAIDARSVVIAPMGVLFKHEKGIQLVDRNMQVSYIGAPVESYNSDTVVSADLVQEQNQVRFLLSSGKCLVWDYFFNRWSVFTVILNGVDAVKWNDSYVYLTSDGTPRIEREGVYTDQGSGINMLVETANLHPLTAVQGAQRVWRLLILGSYKSEHTLRVQQAIDYRNDWIDTMDWNPSGALGTGSYGTGSYGTGQYGGDGDTVYQLRYHLPVQKCQAVRFRISDVGSLGEACSIADLSLEVGVRQGAAKLKADKSR